MSDALQVVKESVEKGIEGDNYIQVDLSTSPPLYIEELFSTTNIVEVDNAFEEVLGWGTLPSRCGMATFQNEPKWKTHPNRRIVCYCI